MAQKKKKQLHKFLFTFWSHAKVGALVVEADFVGNPEQRDMLSSVLVS